MPRGYFITFEGGEGAGKSTQIDRLAARLRRTGYDVVVTREPGGSSGAEALRQIILSGAAEPFGPALETMLFAAARADHVEQTIRPAVERGAVVLCDRFIDSTRVYQGSGDSESKALVARLESVSVGTTRPDLTLILDIAAAEGLRRARLRRGDGVADRYEREDVAIHEARRRAFLAIAAGEPRRCAVIDASRDPDAVEGAIATAILAMLDRSDELATASRAAE